jgi:hypothetical protein
MRRLVYGSPASDEPSGGVKVFHRHVEVLHAMGHEAAIWHPGSVGFRCSWFEHEAPVVETPDLHPANDFIVLPGYKDNVLFVATDGGVYASINAGKNWYRLGANLPIIAAYSLAWNVARNELVVGTHGKSILAYPLQSLLSNVVTSTPQLNLPQHTLKAYPLPFGTSLNLDWEAPEQQSTWNLKVFDAAGKIVLAQNLGSNAFNKLQLQTGQWQKGVYFIHISNGRSQISRKVIKG